MSRDDKISVKRLSYWVACEYGSQNMRPHYHLIIFGLDPKSVSKCLYSGLVYGTHRNYQFFLQSKEG
ncbi:hypothetical protein [Candidatus Endomicrobiellum pyrsonymphae]|uniref:hypothetical protein n=1 Tax=Candidatus Endomicrobiellum pyrsonymphae TaxID=1408203 RepID=UPI0035A85D81